MTHPWAAALRTRFGTAEPSSSLSDLRVELVERGDIQVLYSLAENAGAEFSEPGFDSLVKRAAGHDSLVERICNPQKLLAPERFFA